jgi:hypothetical protein
MKHTYTIEVEIQEGKENFKEIEEKIRNQAFKGAKELSKQILKNHEDWWFQKHKGYRYKGEKTGNFKTSFGEFEIARKKVRYKGKYFYPIDSFAGLIKNKRQTTSFQEILKEEYVDRTFRKGTKNIEKQTSVKLSFVSGWRSFQAIAEKEKKEFCIPSRIKNIPVKKLIGDEKNSCPILCIEEDGTYCRTQPVKLKDQEVKLAVLYTGKKFVGKKHKRAILENKTVIASRKGESVASFTARVAHIATEVYGVNDKTCIILRGDGDSWILRIKYDYFESAYYFLDWWHVKKKMKIVFGEVATEDLIEYVYKRDPEGLLRHINNNYLNVGLEPKRFDIIEKFYNYIENNIEGLKLSNIDPDFKNLHPGMFKRGSGAIERNIDLVIGERCKIKRMRWSGSGLENMVFLRENKINQEINSPILNFFKKAS